MQVLTYLVSGLAALAALWIVDQARREFGRLENDARQLAHDLDVARAVMDRVHDRHEFAESFETISSELLALPIFGPVWDEFRESLDIDAEARLVRSARDPYEFLGPRLLDASDVDQRRIEAVPNRLIAFGLIFTFIGLVLALSIAGIGLSADDFDEVRAALTTLLAAAAVKFITSIAGIGSSLWFTQKRGELLNKIDGLSAAIGRQLDRLTFPLRADIVAEASHRELVRQSQLLERSNEDLANAIATRLHETLQNNLAEAVRPVADRIGEMGRTIAEMNQKALRDMVEQFSKELGGAAREHSQRMMELLYQVEQTVKAMPASIRTASAAIETAGSAFAEATESAAAATEQRLTQAGNVLAELLTETEKNVGSASLALAQVADLLAGMVDRIEQTESASSERAQRAEETLGLAVEQISRVLTRADAAVEVLAPLTPLALRLEEVAGSLARVSETHATLIARGEEMIGRSRSTGDVLSKTAASYSDSNAKLEESLASVFEQLAAGIDLFRSRVEETVERLDEEAARIVARLQAAGERESPPANKPGRRSAK